MESKFLCKQNFKSYLSSSLFKMLVVMAANPAIMRRSHLKHRHSKDYDVSILSSEMDLLTRYCVGRIGTKFFGFESSELQRLPTLTSWKLHAKSDVTLTLIHFRNFPNRMCVMLSVCRIRLGRYHHMHCICQWVMNNYLQLSPVWRHSPLLVGQSRSIELQ